MTTASSAGSGTCMLYPEVSVQAGAGLKLKDVLLHVEGPDSGQRRVGACRAGW